MHDYNLVWGVTIHNGFDDLDLISSLQVYQNDKLILVCCSLMVHGCYTH